MGVIIVLPPAIVIGARVAAEVIMSGVWPKDIPDAPAMKAPGGIMGVKGGGLNSAVDSVSPGILLIRSKFGAPVGTGDASGVGVFLLACTSSRC